MNSIYRVQTKNVTPYGGENLAYKEAVEESRCPLYIQAVYVV
jgi:hypothetical protein